MKNLHYYDKHAGDLKQRLKAALDLDELRELHRLRPWRHALVVARLLLWVGLCGWALWQTRWPWLWAPAAILQGFNILGFIILLHEQVHEAVVSRGHSRLNRVLGLLYALPASISATQFRIWHLDHHNELGSERDDPKRAWLSPKRNARWYKLLYCTPWLFLKYARAAAVEARGYARSEQRTIALERAGNLALHLGLAALLVATGGWSAMFRVWMLPLFFCFPFAFTLNRLGQHYFIDPRDPAKWSTLVDGNPAWRFLFLWSNYHIEHHYFPRVPFYNLKALNRALQPFFRQQGIKSHGYGEILWRWFVENREPHSDWDAPRGGSMARRAEVG
jgi:fatty acid desaturase